MHLLAQCRYVNKLCMPGTKSKLDPKSLFKFQIYISGAEVSDLVSLKKLSAHQLTCWKVVMESPPELLESGMSSPFVLSPQPPLKLAIGSISKK